MGDCLYYYRFFCPSAVPIGRLGIQVVWLVVAGLFRKNGCRNHVSSGYVGRVMVPGVPWLLDIVGSRRN